MAFSNPTPEEGIPTRALAFDRHRVRQIGWLLLCVFALLVGLNLYRARWLSVVFDAVTVILLALALWRNARDHAGQAVRLMAVALALGLGALMLAGQGLYDEAPMAYPALVVFAAMIGSRRLMRWLVAFMLATMALMFVLDRTGILPGVPDGAVGIRLFEMALILLITWMLTHMLTEDLRQAIDRLQGEKQALLLSQKEVERLGQCDALTGLPNRLLARDRLTQLLAQSVESGRIVAVVSLDVDNLKTINDSLGHAAGDALLKQVGSRLLQALRGTDTVARLSGNEFLILLAHLKSESAIAHVIGKINRVFRDPFTLSGDDVAATASLGITVAPRDGNQPDALLKNANLAMYKAKEAGRNTFCFFDASMNAGMAEQLRVATNLRTALDAGELRLYYQPQLDLDSGRIVGAEALLRWPQRDQGMIPPAVFIPIAERSGMIHEIGIWVLQQACRDARRWHSEGLGELSVAVNVSALQLRRRDFDTVVAAALAGAGLPASALELELTESALAADQSELIDLLQRISDAGVRIAIDDFGTGYSNLSYLRRFSVHRLKIDRAFVDRICTDIHNEALVRAIVEMAHCLNLEVVAEGVEDADALRRLRDLGCEGGQGFLWSPAVPVTEFMAMVRAQQDLRIAGMH